MLIIQQLLSLTLDVHTKIVHNGTSDAHNGTSDSAMLLFRHTVNNN